MFVGRDFQPMFPVENVFDSPVYERINYELATLDRESPLILAVVFQGLNTEADWGGSMGEFIRQVGDASAPFEVNVRYFPGHPPTVHVPRDLPLTDVVQAAGAEVADEIAAAHRERPFSVLHCHDWYSLPAGLDAAERAGIPFVFSLHSTEHERTRGGDRGPESETICAWERRGVEQATLVVVPHSSTRQQVIQLYGAMPERVVIVPDKIASEGESSVSPQDLKGSFGLDPGSPVVLFAGEMSHAAGVDLMLDALPSVCAGHGDAQFVFAGDGPLKGELERRAWHTGVGHRCKFFGHVPGDRFESLLMASDFIVIPARTWQDEGLAQRAISCGRPVLTTHAAQIRCVVHGKNGLVTYDNPGSIVWGLKELLANPLQGQMLRAAARLAASSGPSIETIAAEHYLCYENAVRIQRGDRRG
jgi:glycosyltransferase involved in cell wall biosynthesis